MQGVWGCRRPSAAWLALQACSALSLELALTNRTNLAICFFFLKWASEVLSKKQGKEGWTMVTLSLSAEGSLGRGGSSVISKGKAFPAAPCVALKKGAGPGEGE